MGTGAKIPVFAAFYASSPYLRNYLRRSICPPRGQAYAFATFPCATDVKAG